MQLQTDLSEGIRGRLPILPGPLIDTDSPQDFKKFLEVPGFHDVRGIIAGWKPPSGCGGGYHGK